ncbi:threonine synthase [Hymenobacter qilianensis]|uniref:Threonine synthase n=2 Tax=Hymenobacter qilianensis TaxID=1385715 RepID=A0ACB5PP65_9BACT|nr:threonine synthase [Hymenobacter qilianensis]QNP53274.1 threonine synthase [Hymenobacter qilianensis]GGF58129.1 threonine synthase [Hymenobacter qilianensis]
MRYYSLNKQAPAVDFQTATIAGQAPDGGLYFPERIPKFSPNLLHNLSTMPRAEVAFEVIRPYVGNTIPEDVLQKICAETVDFEFPLVPVTERIAALELFHGPTLAFKDVGARFMSRCLGYFSRQQKEPVTVLVATSGDTGGAVADGFLGVEGVEVVILYPSGKVSPLQELQLTTLGQNITALEVRGNFDDCQRLVKQAFLDPHIAAHRQLTSANSINVARWLPQQFYYCYALQQWTQKSPPVVAVPSGNFGNICAGLLAHASGLPIGHFVAACNANSAVADYLRTGTFSARTAVVTLSNAMDVGNPSNFGRILELFGQSHSGVSQLVSGAIISDQQTKETIRRVHQATGYLLDPHGAVAFKALEDYLADHPTDQGIFLETAHPVKFPEVVEPVIGRMVPVPEAVQGLLSRTKHSILLEPEYAALQEFLLR